MSSQIAKYSFINAKLRARISMILPDDVFHQLAKASSLEAALALLRGTPFVDLERIYSETGDLRLAELELFKIEIGLYKNLKQFLHDDSKVVVDALLSGFEIENLKNAIRIYFDRKIRKRSVETAVHYIIYEPIVYNIPIDIVTNAASFEEVAGVCEGTPYGRIIRKYSHTVESEGSLFRMEVGFDHFYYDNLLSAIDKLDSTDRKVALRLIGVEIDLQNISWIIRFKNFYQLPLEAVLAVIIPGGMNLTKAVIDDLYRSQNISSVLQGFIKDRYPGLSILLSSKASDITSRLLLIRRILEEIKKQEVRRILGGYPFTIGIILAYFILKRDELNRIMMVLNAQKYGKQQERIESML